MLRLPMMREGSPFSNVEIILHLLMMVREGALHWLHSPRARSIFGLTREDMSLDGGTAPEEVGRPSALAAPRCFITGGTNPQGSVANVYDTWVPGPGARMAETISESSSACEHLRDSIDPRCFTTVGRTDLAARGSGGSFDRSSVGHVWGTRHYFGSRVPGPGDTGHGTRVAENDLWVSGRLPFNCLRANQRLKWPKVHPSQRMSDPSEMSFEPSLLPPPLLKVLSPDPYKELQTSRNSLVSSELRTRYSFPNTRRHRTRFVWDIVRHKYENRLAPQENGGALVVFPRMPEDVQTANLVS
ncbi:hypothetical protein BDK51DRAFT_48931 [Blyttiomyces helicus]|uniref:Uncharacterized protein n=1 Tax=Blyttiomyces helicus TaxID=388810 RepID=A0A4P9W4P2_9FUNG|nr:hypothetical protein BDK51DRAFT_48931 [Blyttiomyces helicus]|eukprot:RKO85146.1 hypothetical protein BDK51DRAFT_48931 [Blyttiomyces helicus]